MSIVILHIVAHIGQCLDDAHCALGLLLEDEDREVKRSEENGANRRPAAIVLLVEISGDKEDVEARDFIAL